MNDRAPAPSAIARALERRLEDEPVPGLISAYLFGSHAAGRAHRERRRARRVKLEVLGR